MMPAELTPLERWRIQRGSTIRNLLRLAILSRVLPPYSDGKNAQRQLATVRATRPPAPDAPPVYRFDYAAALHKQGQRVIALQAA